MSDDLSRVEQEFPERADWNRLSSAGGTLSAFRIAAAIVNDLQTTERLLVPGLRRALLLIEAEDRSRRHER